MSDDAHAQANAEQVRLLREALAATASLAEQTGPALIATQSPEVGSLPEAPRPRHPISESSTRP